MSKFGKRIYYEKATGNVLVTTSDMQGDAVKQPTVEQDKLLYATFNGLNEEAYDYIELEYGQYAQDFAECDGFVVDISGEPTLKFSYPDPSQPEVPPIYQPSLSVKVAELEDENVATMLALAEAYEISDNQNTEREQEGIDTRLALTETYDVIMNQQLMIDALTARLEALEVKGGA